MEDGTKIPVVQSKPEGFDDTKVPFEITDILQKWYDRDYGFTEVIEPDILEHDWNFRISSIKTEQIWTDWNEIPNPTNYDRIEVQTREQGTETWSINGENTPDDADDITVGLSKDTDYEMRLVLFNAANDEVSISNVLSFTTGGVVIEPEPPVVVEPEVPTEKKDFVINKKVSFVNAKENIFSSTEMFLYHLSTEIPVSEISAKLIFSNNLEMFIQNFGEDKTMSIQAESDEYKYSITYEISKKEITPIPEPTPEEPPVVVDPKPEPTPDPIPEPEPPIETDEEALDMAQKILDFLKKKV